MTNIRVGFGYDVHQLDEGQDLWLGGILIPHYKGTIGHSDADVLIHALCDAILGAAAKRDIGFHFPDTDLAYKGADSKKLLSEVCRIVKEDGWLFVNADVTLVLEKPKVLNHIQAMQECLSDVIGCEMNQISLKATTSERMGFVGKEDGVSAHAVCLIEKAEE